MDELWRLSVGEIAKRIARKQVSSQEIIEAHLARIEAVNPHVNAIVKVLSAEALDAATEADRQLASGAAVGPLHGVPFTVKENLDVAGLPTTWGVPAFSRTIPPQDAPAVERMKAAGAIPIGRTNLPDMALRLDTDSTLYGRTRNPWNPTRTAGGSSGGEAVAIATGMSPVGLGTDIGGSVRSPANACGIASIRPSIGRVPYAGTVPSEDRLLVVQLMDVVGPMARSIADVRIALQVLSGAHPRDPLSLDMPLTKSPRKRPTKVAAAFSPFEGHVAPAVLSAAQRAADALADAGYEVVEINPPDYERAEATWLRLLFSDYESVFEHLAPIMGTDGLAFLNAVKRFAPPLKTASGMSKLLSDRDGLARAWSMFMFEYPLILTPTWTELPFEIGFDVSTAEGSLATRALARSMMPANLFGIPSACVPAGHDPVSNLPVGVLVTGRRYTEEQCLEAAEVIEQSSGISTPIEPRRST